jgi:molecular chaperone GrpE
MPEDRFQKPADNTAPAEPQAQDGPQREQDPRIAELEKAVQQKTEEAAVNLDRYLRAVAEGENFKKRLQKEKTDAIRYANENLLRDMLQVIDNLEAAVEHAELGGNGKSIVEGVELTLRLFRDVLDRYGVKEINDPAGSAFDPATQEASELREHRELPPNTVIEQRAKGYRFGDRLLRPSRVVVASGRPGDEESGGRKEPVH